ncbi:unnamed protein product [Allacma fusca]|uniref:Uncharacterized protein n=1 Tax=Allacma fusca TaxID=39272 RepID=A0A8J2NZ64_9HEXA|nr:unnamed protein product [Allacma fusca]
MGKSWIYAVLLVATAGAISGVPTRTHQLTRAQTPEILNILQQMALSRTNVNLRDSNPRIFAAIGDNCDANDPNPSLKDCDALDSHMVCYSDNKCGCFNLNKMLKDRSDAIPNDLLEFLVAVNENLPELGMHWGASFDHTRKECSLDWKSLCFPKDIDLNELLYPQPPNPELDEISTSMNKLKCAPNLECMSWWNTSQINLGKCIDPKVDDFCFYDSDDESVDYLSLCQRYSNEICYPNHECGCYDTDAFLSVFVDGDEGRALRSMYQEMKDAGLPLTTSKDPVHRNKCMLPEGAACPLGEIELSKYLGSNFVFLDQFNKPLSELECATNLECKHVDIPDFPPKIGQCTAKKAEEGVCAYDWRLNITDYLDLCDVKANQICYKNNKCDCYDTDKFLEILLDMGKGQILRQMYQELKDAGLKLTTSMDTLAKNACLLPKDSACPLGDIELSKELGKEHEYLDVFNKPLSDLKCATNLECKPVDIQNFPRKLGQCHSGTVSIVSGVVLLLSSILFSNFLFGF